MIISTCRVNLGIIVYRKAPDVHQFLLRGHAGRKHDHH